MRKGDWLLLGAMLAAAGPLVAADTDTDTDTRGAAGTIPVDAGEPPDTVPVLPDVEWTLSANVQYDALGGSDLPEGRAKTGELRRAYVTAIADLRGDFRFKLGADLAERAPGRERGSALREASVEYRGGPAYLELGRMVEPFGMLQGGSRSASFMERPVASGLGPGFGIGAAVNWRAERWAITGGLFGPAENDLFFGGRAEQGLTIRVTGVPVRIDDGLVHAGVALSRRKPKDAILQFTAVPESVLLLGLNTSSQRLFTEDFRLLGFELAGQWGPVLARSEFIQARLGESIALEENFPPGADFSFIQPTYEGHYAEVSWVITGERRDYSLRRGLFGGIYPEKPLWRDGGFAGFGAIELAARTGAIDLTDESGGGERSRVDSVALAWYPVEFMKVVVEQVEVDEEAGDGSRDGASALQGRVQLSYSFP